MDSHTEIRASSISKSYGITKKIRALQNVSFKIERGECFSLVGQNGAGKTTLLKILGGILGRYEGEYNLQSRVSYCPENSAFFPYMDATENVEYFSKVFSTEISSQDILKELDLVPRKRLANTFSKGMKRKLDIARSLSVNAKIILMDEPFDGLDPNSSFELVQIIERLKNGGVTFLISSHDLYRVEEISDSVLFLKSGRIAEEYKISGNKKYYIRCDKDCKEAQNWLSDLGCRILSMSESELHFESPENIRPWEIFKSLSEKGIRIEEISKETLESEYRRVMDGIDD